MIVDDIRESRRNDSSTEEGKEKLMLDAQKREFEIPAGAFSKFDRLFSQTKNYLPNKITLWREAIIGTSQRSL